MKINKAKCSLSPVKAVLLGLRGQGRMIPLIPSRSEILHSPLLTEGLGARIALQAAQAYSYLLLDNQLAFFQPTPLQTAQQKLSIDEGQLSNHSKCILK